MNSFPTSDSIVHRNYYDSFGEKKWTRLSRDCPGELLYHVHRDVLRSYVHPDASVLELGAGAGIFSKELVRLAGQLVVSDISEEQLAINKSKMEKLGLEDRIQDFRILDITDLKGVSSGQFDVLLESQNVQIIDKRAAGIFSLTGDEALDQARSDQELWDLLLAKEIEFLAALASSSVVRRFNRRFPDGPLLTPNWRHECIPQLNLNKLN